MTFKQRYREEFREQLRKTFTPNEIRLADSRSLARHVDADVVAKTRVRVFKSKYDKTRKLVNRCGEDDEADKARDTKDWSDLDARDFNLEDNIAQIYWEAYSEGFYGEPFPSKDDDYTCPKCGLKYKMSLKLLPLNCKKCGKQTPLGRLSEDGVMRR